MDERLALRLGWLEEITSAKEWTRATDVQSNNMIGYLLKGDLDTGEAHPMGQRPYRLPLTKRAVVDNEIADMLDKGTIRLLNSPWASPMQWQWRIVIPPTYSGYIRCITRKKENFYGRRSRKMRPYLYGVKFVILRSGRAADAK